MDEHRISLLLASLFSRQPDPKPRERQPWTGVRAWFQDLDLTGLGRWKRGS